MHVLQVIEPGKDGVFRHVEGLCEYMQKQGVRISLAYSDKRSSDRLFHLVEELESSKLKTVNLQIGNFPQPGDIRAFARLLKFCRDERPDVIHAHSSKAGALARLLPLVGVHIPVIYTPNAYYGMGLRGGVTTRVFNAAERLLAPLGHTVNVSTDEKIFARDILHLRAEQQSVIYNAIDTERFHPPSHEERAKARASFGLPQDAIVVGCLARFSYQKNLELLYRALACCKKQTDNLWLLHVGEGDAPGLIESLGISDRVRRVSYRSDTVPFFHAIDAFAMPSRYEGLSFAVLEALGCNIPLILTDVPGNREFQRFGLSHIWCAPNDDLTGFSAAIGSWVVDRALLRPINHRTLAENTFSYAACYGAVLRLYETQARLSGQAKQEIKPPLDKPNTLSKPSCLPVDTHGMRTSDDTRGTERVPTPKSIRVLIVVEPGLDGVFRHVEGLVDHLLKSDAHVDLAFSSRRIGTAMLRLVERVRAAGGEVVDLRVTNIPEVRDTRALVRLIGLIRRIRPDIVHAHSSKAGALVRSVAVLLRWPRYYYTPHAYYGMAKPRTLRVRFFNWIEHVLCRVGATIAISRDEAEFARSTLGVPPDHLHIIHNPVDSARFSPASPEQRRKARAALGIPEQAVVLATIGRMCWQKDPETAYAGVAPLCVQNPDLLFLHLGWGKWKNYLTERGQQLGFSSQLKILDYVDDPRAFYHAIDGLLVSSRYEAGWALVFLEAMACNLPLMAATCMGMSDIGRAGLSHIWTFAPEDVSGCSEAVQRWLASHRAGIQQCNHRAFAMERLSPDRCYGAVLALYLNEAHGLSVSPFE